MTNLPVSTPSADLIAVIDRAARDPTIDVEKMQRLLDIREIELNRFAEKAFNAALVRAQGEMQPIIADANNPQTRSQYATYAALDRECRPIYKRFGLAPSFSTEPTSELNSLLVVCMLGHVDGHARRYQIPMPIDTKGIKGVDMMTRTHATGSAYTYGKRYLLIGMFNLAIEDETDDDGNAASRRRSVPQVRRDVRPMQHYQDDTPIDQDTGEVIDAEPVAPYTIEMNPGSTWAQFLEPLQRQILAARTIGEIDEWMVKNQDLLLKLKEAKPQLFQLFERNIEPHKMALTPQ